jgi:hypothetical protein
VHTGFWWGDLRERVHFEELNVDGNVLKLIFKKWVWGVDRFYLPQNRDRWLACVDAVMKLRDP